MRYSQVFEIDFFISEMPLIAYALAALFAAIIGSFINMLAHRIPTMMEESFLEELYFFADEQKITLSPQTDIAKNKQKLNLFQPSYCPHCKTKLKAWHNIPILGYLLLGGRCGHCKTPIAPRYFITELVSVILVLISLWYFGPSIEFLAYTFFIWALLTLSVIDFETTLLPDTITLPLTWFGMIAAYFQWIPVSFEAAFWGAIVGYLLLYISFWIFKIVTGKEGFGYGDFKLLAAIGAWLGYEPLIAIVLISCLLGILFSQVIFKAARGEAFPFGPYIAMAGVLLLFTQHMSFMQVLMPL